jgi:hypothetical protein
MTGAADAVVADAAYVNLGVGGIDAITLDILAINSCVIFTLSSIAGSDFISAIGVEHMGHSTFPEEILSSIVSLLNTCPQFSEYGSVNSASVIGSRIERSSVSI